MTDIWFNGPVTEAVQTVARNNLVFLVLIYDDSEQSKQLLTTFNNENLHAVMKQKTIAIKMQKGSKEATMFAELYPISKVPVVYFILQGTIKDFGTENLTGDEIMQKIKMLCPPIANQRQPNERQQQVTGQRQQVTDQRRQQQTLYSEKAKKEKKADDEYKRKIKEQIALDRGSRKSDSISKPSSTTVMHHDHCNLNIKQLDGTSLRHSFPSSDTLGQVSQWIDMNRTDGDMPFKLFAQFPNRNFDIGDEQRKLSELRLCPSATLIMKPIKNSTSAYNKPTSSGWLNYVYSAGDAVYSSVSSAASYFIPPTNTPEPGQRLGSRNKYKKDDDDNRHSSTSQE